jgi:uncharacterized membrane protein
VYHLTLEQGHSLATMLVVTAAALAAAGWFYRRGCRPQAPSRWRSLFLLRAAAIVLVALLMFRPVFSYQKDLVQRRAVIFLVDESASMGIADDASGATRFDQERGRVLDWWGKLDKDFDLHVLAFSDQATPLAGPGDLVERKPTGPATSFTRALQTAAHQVPRRDVEAVVLLSDGIHNAAGDPAQVARQLGLVVHTVGVGNSLRNSPSYRDILVTGMDCPDVLPVNNRAKVTAFVDAVGFGGRVVKVILEEDGKPVDEAELVLDDAEGSQEVSLQFLPTVKGRHTYTVRVPVAPGEKIIENNQRSTVAQVVDARIRVLYIEGTLRAEYGALVDRFLSKDPDVEFCALVQTRRNVFAQRTNMDKVRLNGIPTDPAVLEKFDVFVLGDLDGTYLKPEQMELIKKRVRDGAGLVMLGGYHSLGPGGYAGTPLEEILPVFVGGRDIGQVPEPFLPALTPEGRNHPVFANIGKFFPAPNAPPQSAGLPPLDGCVRVAGARPGATVLAVYTPLPAAGPEKAGAPMPVLAVQPCGKGRVAVFTADTTRNWQQAPRALDQESPFLRFWGQTVRWLANRTDAVKAEAGVTARTDKVSYPPDAPITILAVVRDKEGEGTNQARVVARIKGPEGMSAVVPMSLAAGPAGHYSGTFEPKRLGTYEITVEAKVGETALSAEKVAAEVGRPNLEYDRLDLDEKALTRLATETGGRYAHLSTADRLIEELDRKEQRRRVAVEQPLYWPPVYWGLFVGVLAAEWVLRKRYQLR